MDPDAPGTDRRWWRRPVPVAAMVGVALLLGVGGTVLALDRSIDRVEVEGLAGSGDDAEVIVPEVTSGDADDPAPSDAEDLDLGTVAGAERGLTVLLLGSDTRATLSADEQDRLGTGNVPGERTEAIGLVRLDPDREEVRILNVPRDTVLTRCDGSRGRINGAYGIGERDGIGGISCVVQTLTSWSGLEIDHAMKVDFRGFVDIVDALGGVEFHLEAPLRDRNANLDLAAGCVRLDGADALAFARARGIDNDFGRIARQQRLIAEIRAELAEAGVFGDAVRLVRTAEAVARNVELDDTLTLQRIGRLALRYRSTVTADLTTRAVPGQRMTGTEAWLLEVDEGEAQALVAWLRDGEDPREAPTSEVATSEGSSPEDTSDPGANQDAAESTDGSTSGSAGTTDADAGLPDGDATGQTRIDSPASGDTPIGATPQRCG